jgi:hypothetical protein
MRNRFAFQKCSKQNHLRCPPRQLFFVRAFSPPPNMSSPNRNFRPVIDVFALFLDQMGNLTAHFSSHLEAKKWNYLIATNCPSIGPTENITVSF